MINAILGPLAARDSVTVTVTYEALDAAAAETLSKTVRAERALETLKNQNERMRSIWQGEAADNYYQEVTRRLEEINERIAAFRQHAQNLQLICQNYIRTSASIAGTIQTLSDEVIV